MVRNTAREIAAHLSYELSFTDKTVDELLKERLTLGGLCRAGRGGSLYADALTPSRAAYITRLEGGDEHAAELDGYIAAYSKGWKLSRSRRWPLPSCGWPCTRSCTWRTFPTAPPSMRRWRLQSMKRRRRPNSSTAFWAALCGRRSPSNPAEPAERTRRRPQAALRFCVICHAEGGYMGAEKPGALTCCGWLPCGWWSFCIF